MISPPPGNVTSCRRVVVCRPPPLARSEPVVRRSSPRSAFTSVDFPVPDGPRRAAVTPWATCARTAARPNAGRAATETTATSPPAPGLRRRGCLVPEAAGHSRPYFARLGQDVVRSTMLNRHPPRKEPVGTVALEGGAPVVVPPEGLECLHAGIVPTAPEEKAGDGP